MPPPRLAHRPKPAGLLAEGSELLLEVLDPGIIGGVLLPVLGALPDSLIVLNAGLKGSREVAQEQLAVGMGAPRCAVRFAVLRRALGWVGGGSVDQCVRLPSAIAASCLSCLALLAHAAAARIPHFALQGTLAGSTVLLLSLGWGLSVLLGRCDISSESGRAVDKTLTRGEEPSCIKKGPAQPVVMCSGMLCAGVSPQAMLELLQPAICGRPLDRGSQHPHPLQALTSTAPASQPRCGEQRFEAGMCAAEEGLMRHRMQPAVRPENFLPRARRMTCGGVRSSWRRPCCSTASSKCPLSSASLKAPRPL
jgi:hypothetical protein